ncbi:cysteine hydrolase [Amphritea sp. 2_MG-2023]|uniref:cysteine hydrolase family protein n=1 Tax=Amphritea TaxID=515417 RepID=UPI001C07E38A|nr:MULTISPECIES: cysteine hydrolase [Amphritea]MBU2967325.1 cysteine hydrolase [Amphritea atlantica]MDO6420473.1 cysteine hydrolase [Amphritea sp. 2_MG-2023]
MSSWKTSNRSFYYKEAPEPENPIIITGEVALLIIDVQNTYIGRNTPDTEGVVDSRWQPFQDRMENIVIPNIHCLTDIFRKKRLDVIYARIACHTLDGRDRSLSQKKPGWNNLLLPKSSFESQIVKELAPLPEDIVVIKTTDSAVTGTNLRLILNNMGIKTVVCVGIFTDQCVSSTVRSLADESFDVIVVDDACAAGTMDIHNRELETLNMIYCHVMSSEELVNYLP